ncbi:unnamed protein product, partial [Amoebophrya sp. A25]|eukprot:GSA25T00015945001.1
MTLLSRGRAIDSAGPSVNSLWDASNASSSRMLYYPEGGDKQGGNDGSIQNNAYESTALPLTDTSKLSFLSS